MNAISEPVRLELIDADPPEPSPQRAIALATPMQMLQLAVERGADLAYVKQLMDLQDRYQANLAMQAYNEAFAAFKSEAVAVVRNKAMTGGPLNGKKYADLFSVVQAVTPALSKHGLSLSWKLTKDEKDWLEVTCTLRHAMGHSESVAQGGPPDVGGAKNAIQARASTTTFLERYTAKAILGVAEQDDDDDGRGGPGTTDPVLQGYREAAMAGTEALRAHHTKHPPSEEFWKANARALRQAASAADKAGAQA